MHLMGTLFNQHHKLNILKKRYITNTRFGLRPIRATSECWLTLFLMSLMVVMPSAAESSLTANSCDQLHRVVTTMDLKHAWSGTTRLREMESTCTGLENDRTYWQKVLYWQSRATAENLLGNHSRALSYRDKMIRHHPDGVQANVALPRHATSIPAISYVVEQARNHRVVMVNEEHHISTDRLFSLALLHPLYEQGYRYLAVEAVWTGERDLNERGYPIRESGFYVSDVVFAELLRSAVALGYKIVPYEATYEQSQASDDMNELQARDYWQARNLISETIEQDPNAKVLVHCGLQHIEEEVSSRWWPMAYYFREATGLDPLTVDQTLLAERGAKGLEHGWRRDAEARGLVSDDSVVLLDGEGVPLLVDLNKVDMHVLTPRTTISNGRPMWMVMNGRRSRFPIDTVECVEEACVIEVFEANWVERAVPYDRIEVVMDFVDLYLPRGTEVDIRAHRLNGSLVFQRRVKTPM